MKKWISIRHVWAARVGTQRENGLLLSLAPQKPCVDDLQNRGCILLTSDILLVTLRHPLYIPVHSTHRYSVFNFEPRKKHLQNTKKTVLFSKNLNNWAVSKIA